MAVSHAKSITIGDFTGTVTAFNSQASTTTVAATDLARPADWNSAHNQYFTLTGNTNNASTVSGTNVVLSGGNNVTLIGSNNSVIGFSVGNYITTGALSDHSHGNPQLNLTNLSGTTASNSAGFTLSLSAAAPGGGGVTMSRFDPGWPAGFHMATQYGQNSLFFAPICFPHAVAMNVIENYVQFTANTNSTGTYSVTQHLALYTYENSTRISRLTSFEVTTTGLHSGTQNSVSNVGKRRWSGTVGAYTISAGAYVVAFRSSTTFSSNNMTLSNYGISQIATHNSGRLMEATNVSHRLMDWVGVYSATTGALPNSIGLSEVRGTGFGNYRLPLWEVSYTS